MILFLVLPGCGVVQEFFPFRNPPATTSAVDRTRESTIQRLALTVRPDLDQYMQTEQAAIAGTHETIEDHPARFKRRLIVQALTQPWEGLANLERHGLLAAASAENGAPGLAGLLNVLGAALDRTSSFQQTVRLPIKSSATDLIMFLRKSLERASIHREKALSNLSDDERSFLFRQAATIVEQFTPQHSILTEQVLSRLEADLRFAELLEERVDYTNLLASAQILAQLADQPWLQQAAAFPQQVPAAMVPLGITGDILHIEHTPYGLIVIGGLGPNTYDVDHRFGLIVDLGGDDQYRGIIGASTDADHGNAAVIDVSGNDTYDAAALGLATGRLGVGLLLELAGDDVYRLDMGSGGTGFGGLGILYDAQGNDAYIGTRLTQGAAIGGLGLLLDMAGNDRHESHGFSIGFAGPQGVGAVIDVDGDDAYHCGNHYPSAYNSHDAPNGKPGDPLFQYDCFGLGAGSGMRVLTKRQEWLALSQAGGWGLLLDMAGQDRYESANFSQGHGYFFGAGTLFDFDGDDQYQAARYGHGSSAHYGVGLLSDRHGNDYYGSSGPFYNGGVAWDHSVSLLLDSGTQKDRYDFGASTGLGMADYSGWALFIDEGGDDRYRARSGFGRSSEHGVAAFVDLKGTDGYQSEQPVSPTHLQLPPGNGQTAVHPKGGIFIDR